MPARRKGWTSWFLGACGMLMISSTANAQGGAQERTVMRPAADPNGVDLVTGSLTFPEPTIDLPAAGKLRARIKQRDSTGFLSNLAVTVSAVVDLSGIYIDENTNIPEWPRIYTVSVDGQSSDYYCLSPHTSSCEQTAPKDGGYLEFGSGGNGEIVYVAKDGTRVTFPALPGEHDTQNADKGLSYANDMLYPNGEKITYQMAYVPNDGHGVRTTATSNSGYAIFVSDLARTWLKDGVPISTITAAKIDVADNYNFTRVLVDPIGRQTKLRYYALLDPYFQQRSVISWSEDQSGVHTDYTYHKLANGAYDTGYFGTLQIQTLARNGRTWSYSNGGSSRSTTHPDGIASSAASILVSGGLGFVTSSTTRSGRTTLFDYTDWQDPLPWQPKSATNPEGNKEVYTHDSRGNLTSITEIDKSGSSSRLVFEAGYAAVCGDPKTCNQPLWTRDAASAQTDFSYDPAHGGMTVKLEPAGANGLRRKTWNKYASFNTGNGLIWRLSATHICSVHANGENYDCGGATDLVTRFTYWEKTFLPLTVARTNGTNTVQATTTFTYDVAGRPTSTTDPTGVPTYYRYDAVGRRTWEIVPNSVGSFVARRMSYDNGDRIVQVDTGTIPAADSSALTIAATMANIYDAEGNLLRTRLTSAAGTKLAQRNFSYDLVNRGICSARRMDPATFDAATDPCLPGAASVHGPDRVSKALYDADGRVTKMLEGVGVLNGGLGDPVVEIGYTLNGQEQWRQDGNGNRTNYTYDGFDRPWQTIFPNGSQESLQYDASGRVYRATKRDGNYLTYGYDSAGLRVSTAFSTGEPSIAETYDGKMRAAALSQGANTLQVGYDLLGRQNGSQSNGLSIGYELDLAGRRARVTHPDGFYVTYHYDLAGNLTEIRNSGGGTLVAFSYDALNRRAGITRANGAPTGYDYDVAGRLTGLSHNLAGSTQDAAFSFAYNPASQIASTSRDNDNYAWTAHLNVGRNHAVNNLNQYTSAGPATFDYDGRGNLTRSGSYNYSYSLGNLLTSGPGASLSYDPTGRLLRVQGATDTRYLFDGDALLAEYAANGSVLRRYVHGPNVDEPLMWYEGAGTGDPRYLHADDRKSIVAVSNQSGVALSINSYDEYGIPGIANGGTFQFTGQIWLNQLGFYHYKARMYSPTLGRFLQPDPILYEDGMNLYAYVGNDPLNGLDPTGTSCRLGNSGEWVCQVDWVWVQDEATGEWKKRKAEAEDHERYADVERSLTLAYNRARAAGKEEFTIKFKIEEKSYKFNFTGNDVADNLQHRAVTVDPRDKELKMSTLGNDIFVGGQGIDVGKTGAEIETRAVMFIHEGIHNTPGENTIDPENRLLGEGPGVKSHQTPYGGASTAVFYKGSRR